MKGRKGYVPAGSTVPLRQFPHYVESQRTPQTAFYFALFLFGYSVAEVSTIYVIFYYGFNTCVLWVVPTPVSRRYTFLLQ